MRKLIMTMVAACVASVVSVPPAYAEVECSQGSQKSGRCTISVDPVPPSTGGGNAEQSEGSGGSVTPFYEIVVHGQKCDYYPADALVDPQPPRLTQCGKVTPMA